MARNIGPVCRICRREGEKLFLKGEKCFTHCILEKRKSPPGQHGLRTRRRRNVSGYSVMLRAKQKLKAMSGVLERQFRRTFAEAARKKGLTGYNLLLLLSCRLDHVVYRLGFSSSVPQARQMVGHGHVAVNGRRVDIPSFILREGDMITLSTSMRENVLVKKSLEESSKRGIPGWLTFEPKTYEGRLLHFPAREEMFVPASAKPLEQLVVELYSKS